MAEMSSSERGTTVTLAGNAILSLGQSEQIGDSAAILFNSTHASYTQTINLAGFAETVAGISKTTTNADLGIIQNQGASGSTGELIVNNSTDYSYLGDHPGWQRH